MSIYLDANAIVPLFVSEGASTTIAIAIAALAEPPVVSDFCAGEVASAIGRRVRTGELTDIQARAILSAFDDWNMAIGRPIALGRDHLATAVELVRRFELGLRLPDAIHLAICLGEGFTLASHDDRVVKAAVSLGIELLNL